MSGARGELAPASEERRRRRRGWADSEGATEMVGRVEEASCVA